MGTDDDEPFPCALCGAPAMVMGIFLPTELQHATRTATAAVRGLPDPGDRCPIGYGLCGGCAATPDARERVEDRILGLFVKASES